MIFVIASEDAAGEELAKVCPRHVHSLVMGLIGLLPEELYTVDQQTVHDRHIIRIVEVVDERSDDGNVDTWALQLLEGIGIICDQLVSSSSKKSFQVALRTDTCHDNPPHAMYGGIYRQMLVRIRSTQLMLLSWWITPSLVCLFVRP
jgi:hypothetical protein